MRQERGRLWKGHNLGVSSPTTGLGSSVRSHRLNKSLQFLRTSSPLFPRPSSCHAPVPRPTPSPLGQHLSEPLALSGAGSVRALAAE